MWVYATERNGGAYVYVVGGHLSFATYGAFVDACLLLGLEQSAFDDSHLGFAFEIWHDGG